MRHVLALCLLLTPVLAEEADLARRFPAGATAYVEARGLAGKLDAIVESPLGRSVRAHPAFRQFLKSPEGQKLFFGQAMLQSATGHDLRGVLRVLAGKRIALAVYGRPQRVLALAEVDAKGARMLLDGAEILTQERRDVVLPATDASPAVWKMGDLFVCLDGAVLAVGTVPELLQQVRDRTAEGIGETLAGARGLAGADADVFGYVDLETYGAKLREGGKPDDIGQAFLLGSLAHHLPRAPWAALALDLEPEGGAWRASLRGYVPVEEEPEAIRKSFGGELKELPFALPENTLGLLRMRRSLPAMWSHRDVLIEERGIPGLVEFETNFGNLTGGMSWVEHFLPSLRDEDIVVIATRRSFQGKATPAIRLPQGAVLFPIRASDKLGLSFRIGFQTAIGIINAQQGMMGSPFLISNETYEGVEIQSAAYLPPSDGEMEGRKNLPLRYNFEPSAAVVGDYYVLASTKDVLKEIIDARGGKTPVPAGTNAGFWIRPGEVRAALAENREQLVAQTMLKDGLDRAAAEQRVSWLLDLARYAKAMSFRMEESRASVGLTLDLVVGPPEE